MRKASNDKKEGQMLEGVRVLDYGRFIAAPW